MTATLPTAILGRTGLEVTRLGYGGLEVQDAPKGRPVTQKQVEAVLNAALDAGINFVDTANCYGRSEEYIGKYISHRRSEFYLATKCGCSRIINNIWTRENLFRGLHESLRRMKTDYIDVMQLHNPTPDAVEIGSLVEALEEMREQGKVRWIAISTNLPYLPTFVKWGVFDAVQFNYSTLQREHEDWTTTMANAGIGTVVRTRAAKGEPGNDMTDEQRWEKFEQARLDELRDHGESRTAFILRYTLSHPDAHTIVVGTSNAAHLQENVEAARRGPLPPDVVAEANRRLDEVGLKAGPVS